MSYKSRNEFSFTWMIISVFIFIGTELILGGLIGEYVLSRYLSHNLRFLIQGLLNLSSYLIGGFIIGLISPGIRTLEPALGAFLCVSVMLILTFFTPYSFIHFSLLKMMIGGGIAYLLALTGAKFGERLSRN